MSLRQNLAIAPDCAVAKFRAQLAKLNLAKFLAQFVLRLPSLVETVDSLRQNLAIAPDCAVAKFRAQLAKLNLAKFLAQFVLRLPSLVETVDVLLRDLCNCNLLFGGKIFIGIGNFHQVSPIVSSSRRIATILESIKSSLLWNTFKVYNLQKPVRNAHDPEYSQFMDDVGDSISGENISSSLLITTHELDDATSVNFFKRKPSKSFTPITFEYLQHKRNIYEGYWYRKPSFLLIKRNTPEVIDIDNLQ
ncbi:hypothetical protein Glove_236g40 [Diversispora epigaea]|uniref:ATP-dependent DNA helicase n=1 Tax=Diversispora epigaea TaxID=1348612 RepID=A0A397IIH9_9GLOM|nr:hypothetical protein Glove_236g40 [Diversispora epigaea]